MIANIIKEKINSLVIDEKAIVILKGIPISVVDTTVGKINLADIVDNKMG